MSQQPYRSKLAGWGRFPVVEGLVLKSESLAVITQDASLSRGLGRSYGDSSLPARTDLPVADTTLADRLLSFDPVSGVLRAEAGVSLRNSTACFSAGDGLCPSRPALSSSPSAAWSRRTCMARTITLTVVSANTSAASGFAWPMGGSYHARRRASRNCFAPPLAAWD